MASLASILSGSPYSGLRMTLRMLRGRGWVDGARLRRKYTAGRNKALDRSGAIVRNSAKKQFSRRRLLTKPVWKRVGDHNGLPLVSMSFQDSRPGKVTSWRPKTFLYSKIFYARDDRKGSVVIGPDDKVKDVNTLHEFGGSKAIKLTLVRKVPTSKLFQYQVPAALLERRRDARGRYMRQVAYIGMWHSTGKRTTGQVVRRDPGRVPAGRYMERGLVKVRPRIPEQFRDQIQGP